MRISRQKIYSSAGFTLIEVMIVTMILAGVAMIGFSRFNRASNEIKAMVRKISVLTKQTHYKARMTNRLYRIVFDSDKEKGSSIWVESAPKGFLLGESAFHEDPDKKEEEKDENGEVKAPQFTPDSLLKSPIKMPSAVSIKEIEIRGQNENFKEGRTFLYFFPEGLTQEAAIHITAGDKLNWTIVVNPITGQSHVVNEDRPLKELRTE